MNIGPILLTTVNIVIQVLVLLIIVRAFMSFFPQIDRRHPVVNLLDSIVNPILAPFQRMLPPMAGLDFSPILAILTLQIGEYLLATLILGIFRG